MRVIYLVIGLLIAMSSQTMAARFELLNIKNLGYVRTLSGVSDIVKTTQFQIGNTEMLSLPSVEFMIDVERNGELITLVPSDFIFKGIDSTTRDREICTSIELLGKNPSLQLEVYLDYWYDERNTYQQKSISIQPYPKAKGVVIKRVTIESIIFKNTLSPLAVNSAGFVNESKSSFAIFDQKSKKALCWSMSSGVTFLGRNNSFLAYEVADVDVANGYKSGRLTLGAASGKPEEIFAAYRRMLLEARYPTLAKDARFAALQKRFSDYFAEYKYLPSDPESGIDMEARLLGDKGFVLLFNPGAVEASVEISKSDPIFASFSRFELSDWTSMESGSKIESSNIAVPAGGYKIIGVNIDG